MSNAHGARGWPEWTAQLRHGASRSSQVIFESAQVCGYDGVAGRAVRRGKQLPDLIQRHLQLTKALDHLRLRNLAGQITPVAAMGIDFGRPQEAGVVIMP